MSEATIRENHELYGGEVVIEYLPKSHYYYLIKDGKTLEKKKRLSGVTTFTGQLDKSKPLMIWATRLFTSTVKELMGDGAKFSKDDVLSMVTALVGDNMYGPYWLYVPTDYFVALGDDFKSNSDKTTMQRILEIPGVEQVKASSNLTGGASGEVVLVQPTRDVVDLVIGAQPTTVQWETEGGMVSNFKVLSIMIPRIKSDANSQSGIAHYSV
ncbi:hypothetical protein LCGC14_1330980 [marine sediment metagenome]|uniref:Uncharacterized protein n=1 Tax=marine sediment metagenome TaxID=412755 RepID=A0A0F9KGN1_9ZZZZ